MRFVFKRFRLNKKMMSEIVSYDSMTVSIEDITCLGRGIGS